MQKERDRISIGMSVAEHVEEIYPFIISDSRNRRSFFMIQIEFKLRNAKLYSFSFLP